MGSYKIGLESNQLKDFKVTIDGVILTQGQVLSLRMSWDIATFRVVGTLVFKDLSNLVEGIPIRGDNAVKMTMTDFDDKKSTQEMTVVDVTHSKGQTGVPAVVLTLVDPITMGAIQLFPPSSWKKVDMVGIVDDSRVLKPLLDKFKKKRDFTSDLTKRENFVMPLHTSFNTVMIWLAKTNNVMFYQTRKDYVIQPLKELFSRGKKGDFFRYKTPNPNYRRRMYEYDTSFGKLMEANLFQPKGKVTHFNRDNKGEKNKKNDFDGATADLGSTGNKESKLTSTTEKHFYRSDYTVEDETGSMWERNSYKDISIYMIVPGQFDTNIGDIVELKLVHYADENEPERNINGLWLISEIVDIVTPPDFVQRITLSRAKFTK